MSQNENRAPVIVIKGAGEKATAIAHTLFCEGFTRVIMSEIAHPRSERRGVTFSEAVFDQVKVVEGVTAALTKPEPEQIKIGWHKGVIPVTIDPNLTLLNTISPNILVDAVMAKRNTGTKMDMAPMVVALGPGFCAGKDVGYVIETRPQSKHLGKVIQNGYADKNTHEPSLINGMGVERLIFSSETGTLILNKNISDVVEKDTPIAEVSGTPIKAPIKGSIFGIMRENTKVKKGEKIGDMDPRCQQNTCYQITPQSKTIATGVLNLIQKQAPSP